MNCQYKMDRCKEKCKKNFQRKLNKADGRNAEQSSVSSELWMQLVATIKRLFIASKSFRGLHKMSPKFERLPSSVIPSAYDILLKPDCKKLVFNGRQTVKVDVKEPVECVRAGD